MNSAGDSFSWPFQAPGWFGTMVLQGLIFIIPIIGWIALVGWMVKTIDNYRAGRPELAPAGFHLERGAGLFLVYLVYAVVFATPGIIVSSFGHGAVALGDLVSFLLRLLLYFIAPSVILFTYRGGIGAGFDVGRIWQFATSNAATSVIAGLIMFVASIISGLGAIVCLVGLLFTIPYGTAITAGVVAWYERAMGAPSVAPPGPAV